jgi:RimJ/RimL family protein N-acetyltransferase
MITLRPVTDKDCKMVWFWANDPQVRAFSFSKDDISYDTHIRWFEMKLNDPNCAFFIADKTNHQSVGLVRYDLTGEDATISVIVSKNFKGQGYGSHIIKNGSERIFKTRQVAKIHAYMLPQNYASVKAFKKANFKFMENTIVKGQPAIHFVLTKEALT